MERAEKASPSWNAFHEGEEEKCGKAKESDRLERPLATPFENDVVHQPVFLGLLAGHKEVAVSVALYLFDFFPGVVL